MKRYILNLLIAIDQLANALLRGNPDETLSSRAYRMQIKGQRYWGWTAAMIDALAYLLTRKEEHCKRAWEAEQI